MTITEMQCVSRMTGNSLRDKIRDGELKKRLGVNPAIDHIKNQQVKSFGHITRRKELNIPQGTIIKRYEKTRPRGRLLKGWIEGILNTLRDITVEEAIKKQETANCVSPRRSRTERKDRRRRRRRALGF
ncbi:hypothetical protein BsWGS_27621 [Bradybaena similaris]